MKNKPVKKPKKKTEKKQEKKPVKKTARKPVARPRKKAGSTLVFNQIELARALGIGRSAVQNAIVNAKIVMNVDGGIDPNKNIKYIVSKARTTISQELYDAFIDPKVRGAIRNHFKRIISQAGIKFEQLTRARLELADEKRKYAGLDFLKYAFQFFAEYKDSLPALINDPEFQTKLSELFKNSGGDNDLAAITFIRERLHIIFKKLHDKLIENVLTEGTVFQNQSATQDNNKSIDDDSIVDEPRTAKNIKGVNISALIAEADQALIELASTLAGLKEVEKTREQLQTLLAQQQIADIKLIENYFAYCERLMQDSYRRPNEISPVLNSFYRGEDISGAGKLLIRELTSVADQAQNDLLKEMESDGFKRTAIPYDFKD